jgi:pSer/pThr/pTyr-binding forkhead associated (FHA) protein
VLSGQEAASGRPIEHRVEAARIAAAGGRLVIGRDPQSSDIVIADETISKNGHAALSIEAGGLMLTDLGSRNGTSLNGRPVDPKLSPRGVAIHSGDVIVLGAVRLTLSRERSSS